MKASVNQNFEVLLNFREGLAKAPAGFGKLLGKSSAVSEAKLIFFRIFTRVVLETFPGRFKRLASAVSEG